ncbi:MAG: hypothetical protein AB1420_12935 [Bacillota bacterium]
MHVKGVYIDNTFAEGFTMYGTRILITAVTEKWAYESALAVTGFASSVIGCGCEAGIEGKAVSTPDGRPGYNILLFAMNMEDLQKHLIQRIGQCIMTVPSTACYNNLEGQATVAVGNKIRYFGDGYQSSKLIGSRRLWRVPVMDGEFILALVYYGLCKK